MVLGVCGLTATQGVLPKRKPPAAFFPILANSSIALFCSAAPASCPASQVDCRPVLFLADCPFFGMRSYCYVFPLLLLGSTAWADAIYKCTDPYSGGILISNSPIDRSCRSLFGNGKPAQGSYPAYPNQNSRPRVQGNTLGAPPSISPADFPRVGQDAQKSRDVDRRRILEQELASEQKSLDAAQQELSTQESARSDGNPQRQQERLQPYRDKIALHQRNIAALRREMTAIK